MSAGFVPLGKFISIIRNGLNAVQYDRPLDGSMLPISRIETISEGIIDFTRVKYAQVSEADKKKYALRPGDILFSHINSPEHIGKTAIFRSERTLVQGINLLLLRPDTERCYPEYLNYYLKSFEVRARFRARCKKAVNQASLTQHDVTSLEVPDIPLIEQTRIAAILAKADRLRRLRRAARELGDTYLQSVFLEMFGDPVANPKKWEVKTLSALKTKFSYGTSAKCYTESLGLPVLRIPNILSREISLEDLKYAELPVREAAKLSLRQGDLLFVRTNGNPDYVGRCAVFDLAAEYLFASYLIRARMDLGKVNPWFLATYLHMNAGRHAMSPYIRTTAGQSNIGMEGLGQIPVPLPPFPLQQQFAAIVRQFERLRAQQRVAERQTEHLFQTLLHRAFRGELMEA